MGAGQGKNAFHRRWSMMWSRRPTAMKRRHQHPQPRCAAATAAVAIYSPPARGRAFARPLADCGLIADLPGIQEPKNQPQFPRALPHKPPYPPIGPLFPVQRAVFCEPASNFRRPRPCSTRKFPRKAICGSGAALSARCRTGGRVPRGCSAGALASSDGWATAHPGETACEPFARTG